MLYHVHVYSVKALCEVDVEAESEEDARAEGLKAAKSGKGLPSLWLPPDCELVAVGPWPFVENDADAV